MFQKTGNHYSGFEELEITEGPFKGLRWYYTRVEIKERDGAGVLSFDYFTTNEVKGPKDVKEQVLGEILESIIQVMMDSNRAGEKEIIYYGGTDGSSK